MRGGQPAAGRLVLGRRAASRAHRNFEMRSGARPPTGAGPKGAQMRRAVPGRASHPFGREGSPAHLEGRHRSRRAGRQYRRRRLFPWQGSRVPHRGRPGRQLGHSRQASGLGCPRRQTPCAASAYVRLRSQGHSSAPPRDRPGLHSMVASAPAGVVSLANRVILQPARQRLRQAATRDVLPRGRAQPPGAQAPCQVAGASAPVRRVRISPTVRSRPSGSGSGRCAWT